MTADEFMGRKVHQMIWDRRLTNRKLAAGLGVEESALSRKLRGRAKWSLDELLGVSRFFDVPIEDLLPEPRRWAAERNRPRPIEAEGDQVAGAGFEPATSGLRAPAHGLARIIPFPLPRQTADPGARTSEATRGDAPRSA